MKSSITKTSHSGIYSNEILPKFGTSYPDKPGQVSEGSGQVMTSKKQL